MRNYHQLRKIDPRYREKYLNYVMKWMLNRHFFWRTQTCNILKEHQKEMKSDPEHLTTRFLKDILEVDCS